MKNLLRVSIFLPLSFLIALLFILAYLNQRIKENTEKNALFPTTISLPDRHTYPILKSVLGADPSKTETLDISAVGALVMDDDSKVVLFAKNENLRFSLASTTKIMTALVALDHYGENDVLEVKTDRKDVHGAVVGFQKGETFTFLDMLYALLLPSGNDAALVLAQNYPQGEEAFVAKMNQKAKSLHLSHTHFKDPAGLLDDADYTTVLDLARLASMALKNKMFAEIVGRKKQVITSIDGTNSYKLYNLNRLLGSYGIDGVKTGFTDGAGGVLVTSVHTKDDRRLIIVVMKSQDRFFDTQKLLDFVMGNIEYKKF